MTLPCIPPITYCPDWQNSLHQLNLALCGACGFSSDLALVKYLLTTPEVKAQINCFDSHPLRSACKYGNLEIASYLLTSPELSQHARIHSGDDALGIACSWGHLKVVKYLLTSADIKESVNVHVGSGYPLRAACHNQHLHVVKYLLSDEELKSLGRQADVHADTNQCLRRAIENSHDGVINLLLYDLRLEVAPLVYEHMQAKDAKDLRHRIEKRDFYFEMKDNALLRQEKPDASVRKIKL